MFALLELLLCTASLITRSLASFCGSTGVPYSFEVLPSGAPVLGCAQPSCVANPTDAANELSTNFLTNSDGQADGFMRDDSSAKQSRIARPDHYTKKLIANCSGKFTDLSCPRKDQWVGGIEYIDHPRQPLILQCCTFAGLRFSQEVGVTNVGPGEAITGGEVIRDGRQISFDVIANARKVIDASTHVVSYEVTVRRMNCLPDPPEPVVEFEKDVSDEVLKVLTKATNRTSSKHTSKKFEATDDAQAFTISTHESAKKHHKKKLINQESVPELDVEREHTGAHGHHHSSNDFRNVQAPSLVDNINVAPGIMNNFSTNSRQQTVISEHQVVKQQQIPENANAGQQQIQQQGGIGSQQTGFVRQTEFGGQQAGFSAQQAGFGNQQARFGSQQAEFGSQQAGFGGQRIGFRSQQTGFGDQSAVFGNQQPLLSGQQPEFNGHKPEHDDRRAGFGGQRAEFRASHEPEFGGQQNGFGAQQTSQLPNANSRFGAQPHKPFDFGVHPLSHRQLGFGAQQQHAALGVPQQRIDAGVGPSSFGQAQPLAYGPSTYPLASGGPYPNSGRNVPIRPEYAGQVQTENACGDCRPVYCPQTRCINDQGPAPLSFPTLPPHTFATLPPHTFNTFPPHTFRTFPPHTFRTLPPHTFGTFPTFPTPASLPAVAVLSSHTLTDERKAVDEQSQPRNSSASLGVFTFPTLPTMTPFTLATFPPFEEMMRRLRAGNYTFATFAPITFTPMPTTTIPTPPSLSVEPPNQQPHSAIIQNFGPPLSKDSNSRLPGEYMKEWSDPSATGKIGPPQSSDLNQV